MAEMSTVSRRYSTTQARRKSTLQQHSSLCCCVAHRRFTDAALGLEGSPVASAESVGDAPDSASGGRLAR